MGDRRVAYRVLVGRPEGKRPLGRPRRRWENNSINIYLQEVGWGGTDWIHPAQDRDSWWTLENALPQNAANFVTGVHTPYCQASGSKRVVRGSQGIRGYICVMTAFKFTDFFKLKAYHIVRKSRNFFNW